MLKTATIEDVEIVIEKLVKFKDENIKALNQISSKLTDENLNIVRELVVKLTDENLNTLDKILVALKYIVFEILTESSNYKR